MVFQHRPEAVEIVFRRILFYPEDRMRIAHAGDARRMQHRRIDRPDLQFDFRRVGKLLGQRNVLPAELRHAHVDSDRGIAVDRRRQHPGAGAEQPIRLCVFTVEIGNDTAHAVAAGARFAAVRIVDQDAGIEPLALRRSDFHELVEGNGLVERDGGLRRDIVRTAAHVGNDDLVAGTIHLEKGYIRSHG